MKWLVILCIIAACTDSRRPATLRELYKVPPPTTIDRAHTALVLVDFQEEFFSGGLPLPDAALAREQATRLLHAARSAGVTVIHVRNITPAGSRVFAAGTRGADIVTSLAPEPTELVITKRSGGAFTNTDLDVQLKARGIRTVVLAGLMTHLAVALSAQDAGVLGYQVIVASDACATRALPVPTKQNTVDAKTLHDVALASLADRFADVLTTDSVLGLVSSSHDGG